MAKISLARDQLSAEILPEEGAVMSQLSVNGTPIVAKTPWADEVTASAHPAKDEPTWVSRWRGGWQLCAPITGQPVASDAQPAFHGAASQANWTVSEVSSSEATLEWTDDLLGLAIRRTWSLLSAGRVKVSTKLKNLSPESRLFGIAEHLILGGDLLQPLIEQGARAKLDYSSGATLHELDYAGAPTGRVLQGTEIGPQFKVLDRLQQARVFALAGLQPQRISLAVGPWQLHIDWEGLPHALIWQEFATSLDHPWNGEVLALGIEPTTTPHGVGAAAPGNPFLAGHAEFEWSTTLTIQRTGDLNE